MKKENKLPENIKNHFLNEHELALLSLKNKGTEVRIPMHVVNMNIKFNDPEKGERITRTILPDMIIIVDDRSISEDKIFRQGIQYLIAYDRTSFPLAHVYASSSSLCLGNIFVPSQISKYNPMQPLETLLIHNDRFTPHGEPKLLTTQKQKEEMVNYLSKRFPNITNKIDFEEDYILNDTIWQIGNYVLENTETDTQAYDIMDYVFRQLFQHNIKKETTN